MTNPDLLFLITTVLTVFVIIRGGGVSPATLLAGINIINAAYFYVVVRLGIVPLEPNAWSYKNIPAYAQNIHIAMGLFLGVVTAALFATEVARLFAGPRLQKTRDGNIDAVRAALALVTSPTGTILTTILVLVIGLLLFLHAIGGGLETVLLPSTYLQYRGQLATPSPLPGVLFIHGQLKIIGFLIIPLMVIHFRFGKYPLLIAEIVIFLYVNIIGFALSSRSIVLSVAMVIIMMQLTSRHRPTRSVWFFLPIFLIFYNAVLVGRSVDRVGLPSMVSNLFEINTDMASNSDLLWSITRGSFSGGFHFLEPVVRDERRFSHRYQVLSFSPLISAFDHFNTVGAPERRKINPSAPYSTFAELWYFSRRFQLAFMVIFVGGLTYMTYVWLKYRDIICAMFLAPALLVFLKIYAYPVRNNMRYFYIAVLLAGAAAYLHRLLLPEGRLGRAARGLEGSPMREGPAFPGKAAEAGSRSWAGPERGSAPGGEAAAWTVSRRWRKASPAAWQGRWRGTPGRPTSAWPTRT